VPELAVFICDVQVSRPYIRLVAILTLVWTLYASMRIRLFTRKMEQVYNLELTSYLYSVLAGKYLRIQAGELMNGRTGYELKFLKSDYP